MFFVESHYYGTVVRFLPICYDCGLGEESLVNNDNTGSETKFCNCIFNLSYMLQ